MDKQKKKSEAVNLFSQKLISDFSNCAAVYAVLMAGEKHQNGETERYYDFFKKGYANEALAKTVGKEFNLSEESISEGINNLINSSLKNIKNGNDEYKIIDRTLECEEITKDVSGYVDKMKSRYGLKID